MQGIKSTMAASIKAILGLGVIAMAGFVLAHIVLNYELYYIVIAAVAVASLLIFWRRIDIALFVYALLAPFVIGGSPEIQSSRSGYDVSVLPSQAGLALLLLLIIIRWIFSGRDIHVPSFTKPLAAFIGVALLSVASTYYIWDSSIPSSERRIVNQAAEVLLYALCVVAFFVAANAFDNRKAVEKMIWPVTLSGLFVSACGLVAPDYMIPVSRSQFLVATALVLIMAKLLFGQLRPVAIFGWMLLFIPLLWGCYHSLDWVSGWLAASIGMSVVIFLRSKKVAISLAAIVLFALFIYPGIYHGLYQESRAQGDLDRVAMWSDAYHMASSVNPILGIGPASYMPYARKYSTLWYGDATYTTAHSNYSQTIAELGLLGVLAFLWVLISGVRTSLKTIERSEQEFRWLAVGTAAVFIAFALVSLVGDYLFPSRVNGGLTSFGTSVQVWLLLGAACAIIWQRDKADSEEVVVKEQDHASVHMHS